MPTLYNKGLHSISLITTTKQHKQIRWFPDFVAQVSLSGETPSSSPVCTKGKVHEKSFHARSASLPCRSHPIISEVEDRIAALRSWQSESESRSICTGLVLTEQLHTSIDDLLYLPQSQDSLRCRSSWTDNLLSDFLLLADTHSTFRSIVMALKQHQSAAQVAIRRWDEASVISCSKSQRLAEKELIKLTTTFRKVSKSNGLYTLDAGEAELARILREATLVTVLASSSVFLATSTAASSAASAVMSCYSTSSNNSWMVVPLKKLSSSPKKNEFTQEEQRMNALQCLEGLEECLRALESESERVFRTLVKTRVALLNIQTS